MASPTSNRNLADTVRDITENFARQMTAAFSGDSGIISGGPMFGGVPGSGPFMPSGHSTTLPVGRGRGIRNPLINNTFGGSSQTPHRPVNSRGRQRGRSADFARRNSSAASSASSDVSDQDGHDRQRHRRRQRPPHDGERIRPSGNWSRTFGDRATDNLDVYFDQFLYHAQRCGWDDREKISIFFNSLRGEATRIDIGNIDGISWYEFEERFRAEWHPGSMQVANRAIFNGAARTVNESPFEFLRRLRELAAQAYRDLTPDAKDTLICQRFVEGQPRAVKENLVSARLDTIGDALTAIVGVETRMAQWGLNTMNSGKHGRARALVGEFDDDFSSDSSDMNQHREEANGWIRRAVKSCHVDNNGEFEEEDVFRVLVAQGVPQIVPLPEGHCGFCLKANHTWKRCYRLRDILRNHGMKEEHLPGFRRPDAGPNTTGPRSGNPEAPRRSEN